MQKKFFLDEAGAVNRPTRMKYVKGGRLTTLEGASAAHMMNESP